MKIHGSALEYTLKPHYQRFAPYASEGLRAGAGGAGRLAPHRREPVGGDAARGPARAHVPRPARGRRRTRSCRASPTEAAAELDGLVRWLDSRAARRASTPRPPRRSTALCDPRRERRRPARSWPQVRAGYDTVGIDVGAPDALAAIDPTRHRVVCFVGKLIVSKGIDLLLAAWPLVLAREPRRAAGGGRLRHLPRGARGAAARARARRRAAADARLPPRPRARGRAARPAHLPAHLPREPRGPPRALLRGRARRCARAIVFTGRLEHGELGAAAAAPPRRWSCRACSRRRSGWWRPRRPPAARCRSAPGTPASPRWRRSWARSCRRRCARCSPSSAACARWTEIARGAQRLARAGRAAARAPRARRWRGRPRTTSAGRRWRRRVVAAAKGRIGGAGAGARAVPFCRRLAEP